MERQLIHTVVDPTVRHDNHLPRCCMHMGVSVQEKAPALTTLTSELSRSLALPAALPGVYCTDVLRQHEARRPGDHGGHNPALRGAFVVTGRPFPGSVARFNIACRS